MTTHGMSNSKIYRVWRGIINRCENPNHKDYARYGGRGVRVCDEWKTFDGFYKWAQGSGYAEGLQIDRTDNDGDYRPDNCRWITQLENENNRRDTVFIEYNGERISLSNLARKTGINRSTLYDRLFKYGFTLQEAISLPVKVGNNKSLRGGRK